MSSTNSMEEYYQKVIQLQDKLRHSEEERLKLEMKYNEMIQVMKEEEEIHFKKLRSKYKGFLEEDRRRQQRNDKILDALEKIESRTLMWKAKSEKFKTFKKRYQHYLPPNQTIVDEDLKLGPGVKKDVIENYLQSISSVKPSENIVQPPEITYSNLGNVNSVYWKNPNHSEKHDLEKPNIYERDFNSTQLKTTKDFENSLKQNTKPMSSTSTPLNVLDFKGSSYIQHGTAEGPIQRSLEVHSELQRLLKEDKNADINNTPYIPQYRLLPQNNIKISSIENRINDSNFKQCKSEPLRFHEPLQNIQPSIETQPQVVSKPALSQGLEIVNKTEKLVNVQNLPPIPVARKELSTTDKSKPTKDIISIPRKEVVTTTTDKADEDSQQILSSLPREKYEPEDDLEILKPVEKLNINEELEHHNIDLVQKSIKEPQEEVTDEAPLLYNVEKPDFDDTETHQPKNLSNEYMQPNYTENVPPLQQYDDGGQILQQQETIKEPLQQDTFNNQPQHDQNGQALLQHGESEQQLQQYDENGQPLQIYNENEQLLQYDENGQPLPEYDVNGQPLAQYQENQQLQQYDENGQPVQQYDENGQPLQYYAEDPSVTQYYNDTGQFPQYDENGQLLQQYDENGQLLQQYDENAQPSEQYYNNDVVQYDENGQPVLQYDANGQPLVQYDENGQLIQQYDENGQPLNYDSNAQTFLGYNEDSQIAYDENGQPISQYIPHQIDTEHSATNQYHEDEIKQPNEGQETIQQQHLQKEQVANAENTQQDTKSSNDIDDKKSAE